MSKTDPNYPEVAPPANGPMPSFDAVRADEDERSELRRNQTVPMPVGLRAELAVHELPSLPAEHLRSTDDMDDALKSMRTDPEAEPVRPRTARKWMSLLLLVVSTIAGGIGYVLWRASNGDATSTHTTNTLERPPLLPPQARAAAPSPEVALPQATAEATVATASRNPAPSPSVRTKPIDHKAAPTKPPKVKGAEPEPDPNELMFKPQ